MYLNVSKYIINHGYLKKKLKKKTFIFLQLISHLYKELADWTPYMFKTLSCVCNGFVSIVFDQFRPNWSYCPAFLVRSFVYDCFCCHFYEFLFCGYRTNKQASLNTFLNMELLWTTVNFELELTQCGRSVLISL